MDHRAQVRPVHRENLRRRLNPTCRKPMIALCCWCDTVSVVMPAGDQSARPDEGLPVPNSPADAARNPAQVSFWLLEPVADAAMTYFYLLRPAVCHGHRNPGHVPGRHGCA